MEEQIFWEMKEAHRARAQSGLWEGGEAGEELHSLHSLTYVYLIFY